MTFLSVARRRPLRVLGLYRSSGKHAAPRGSVPRTSAGSPRRAAHAASLRRLASQQDSQDKAA